MKIGDILSGAYHYSARVPVFARVIKVTPSFVYIERLEKVMATNEDGYGQAGTLMPNLEGPATVIKGRFKIKNYNGAEYISLDNYCSLYHWNGKGEAFWGD